MITSNRQTQMYATKKSYEEIDEFIKIKKKENFYITDIDFGNGLYSVIMETGD
jgi:hypothetical protein